MKKSTIVLSLIAVVTGLFLGLSVNAQTLYVPGGTVGNITGTNVGIGTSTPASYAKLDVRGGALQVVNYSTDGYGYIGRSTDPGNDSYFYHRITTNYHILGTNKNGSGTLRKLGFAVGGGDVETDIKMTIDNIGRVGIGTTTPSTKLEVNGKLTLNSTGWDDHLQITRGASYGGKFIPDNSAGTYGLRLDLIGTGSNFCVMSGNVGVNNLSPSAKLQVTNGSVLFDAPLSGALGSTPISGSGTRMMWIPAKGAFRAGMIDGTQWDDASIGDQSFAVGRNTIASAQYATALGVFTTASALYATAFGQFTTASGTNSTAFGRSSNASGANSTAFGNVTTASGNYSTACGFVTTAQAYNSFVLGQYNYNPGTYNTTSWVTTDPLFVIGNGTSTTPSNAVTVLKNGKVSIGVPDNKMVGNYNLYVKDGVLAGRCRVADINTADWADFVFEKNYDLMSLNEVEKFVKQNKHLPDVPSASEISKTGIDVAKMDATLLKKIEELTLYTIELQKQVDELKKQK